MVCLQNYEGEKSCNLKAKSPVPLLLNLLSSDFVLWIVALSECTFSRKEETWSQILVSSSSSWLPLNLFTPVKMVRIYLHKAKSQTTFNKFLLVILSK